MLAEDVDVGKSVKHHYSGIDWQLESSEFIAKGTEVVVVELQVGVMKIQKK